MNFIARKLARSKWEKAPALDKSEISADAITGCLRTTNDTLSFWACEKRQDSLENVVLALASGAQRVDKMHILLLEEQVLNDLGLPLVETAGETPVIDLRHLHRDIVRLSLERLSTLAREIAPRARDPQDSYCLLFRKKQVVDILLTAIRDNKLPLKSLHSTVQDQLIKQDKSLARSLSLRRRFARLLRRLSEYLESP